MSAHSNFFLLKQTEGDDGDDEEEEHEEEGEIVKPSSVVPHSVEYDAETQALIEGITQSIL